MLKLLNRLALIHLTAIGGMLASPALAADATVQKPTSIPFDQLGAVAQKQYSGDGLAITPIPGGARLKCVFQKLAGDLTGEGLWLRSTTGEPSAPRFRVVARSLGRAGAPAIPLPVQGTVACTNDRAVFVRPGLTEEYTVTVDGVRQDFVVGEKPAGNGALRLELAVDGARAESSARGAQLVLDKGDRTLDYSRLKVTDARGKTLPAAIEVAAADRLAVVVQDAGASYPVRIDPTFSDANWDNNFNPGIPGIAGDSIHAAVIDGSGNLFIGGSFSLVGNLLVTNIAKWNGTSWSSVGQGVGVLGGGGVSALAFMGTNLYAGGFFTAASGTAANNIAQWNGSTWSALGTGLNDRVTSLAVNGTNLYAGGGFTTAGGVPANSLAKWNGSTWSALGSGLAGQYGSSVYALATNGANLYVGGTFTSAGGVLATNLAMWNGSAWSAVGSGVDGAVNALLQSGGNLYVGGRFSRAGNVLAANIAMWNGSAWSAFGQGIDSGSVQAIATIGPTLYVAGGFQSASGVAATNIAKWNGSAWSGLGQGANGGIAALVSSGSTLYVAGQFDSAGSVAASCIASWNGSAWSAFGKGLNNIVNGLALAGGNLYAIGTFSGAGTNAARSVARWDGSSWSALSSGIDGTVNSIQTDGTNIYVGGGFNSAGGVAATNVAKWNGSSWSGLDLPSIDGGDQPFITCLALGSSQLYAAGTTYGVITDEYGIEHFGSFGNLLSWNGTNWSVITTLTNGSISSMAASGTNLFIGGNFSGVGGAAATNIAEWNGLSWSALGAGVNNLVASLLSSGTNLYVSGFFTQAGGLSAQGFARWNGSTWSAFGTGLSNSPVLPYVSAMALEGTYLYVIGSFNAIGGVSANHIAVWDGSAWSAIGQGLSGSVNALTTTGTGKLYVGGSFYMAGTNLSPFIAEAAIPLPIATITSVTGPTNGLYGTGKTLAFTVDLSTVVTVSGTPQIALNIGGVTRYATYSGGSGGTQLTFTYTLQPGDADTNGISVTSPITLGGGTIQNAAGPATLTFIPPATSSVQVDTVAPAVVSVVRLIPAAQPLPGGTLSVTFQVTYSKPVMNVEAAGFAVADVNGGTVTGIISSVTGGPTVYNVTVAITGGSGEFRLNVLN